MIRVVNLRTYKAQKNEVLIKVDRSNKILGNKFIMKSESERDTVCDYYENWFVTQINNKNQTVLNELRRIYRLALKHDIALGCWCYPKRCHAFTIKLFLDSFLPKTKANNPESSLMIVDGNILNVKSGMIIHQVNNCGKMGAGLAKDIRKLYPAHYSDYMSVYASSPKDSNNKNKSSVLLGSYVDTTIGDLTIRGIFSQDGYGRDKQYTSNEYFKKCLEDIAKLKVDAVYIPYQIGCGLAGGNWEEISSIILEVLPTAIIVRKTS